MNLKEEIYSRIFRYTYQKKFSLKASQLIFNYIDLIYSCSTPSVSLPMALGLLYTDVNEARKYHKIERTRIDNILRIFSGQLNDCYEEYYNKKAARTIYSFNDINEFFNRAIINYTPTIIEPIYNMEESK